MVRNRRVGVVAGFAALVLSTGWALQAQETKTTTEKIKEKAGSAASSVKKGFSDAGAAVKGTLTQAKEHVVSMGIESRVYARLHWDKALAGAKIDLSAPRQGTIVLTGTLADVKTRDKAIALTADTVGVTDVVDHLTVSVPEPAEVK